MGADQEQVGNTANEIKGDFSQDIDDVSVDTMWRATLEYAQSAIRTALFINAGAAIAILAYMGNIGKSNPVFAEQLSHSIIAFIIGVLSAGIAYGIAHLSQAQFFFALKRKNELETLYNYHYYFDDDIYKKHDRKGNQMRKQSVIFTVLSYALFLLSSIYTYLVFINHY